MKIVVTGDVSIEVAHAGSEQYVGLGGRAGAAALAAARLGASVHLIPSGSSGYYDMLRHICHVEGISLRGGSNYQTPCSVRYVHEGGHSETLVSPTAPLPDMDTLQAVEDSLDDGDLLLVFGDSPDLMDVAREVRGKVTTLVAPRHYRVGMEKALDGSADILAVRAGYMKAMRPQDIARTRKSRIRRTAESVGASMCLLLPKEGGGVMETGEEHLAQWPYSMEVVDGHHRDATFVGALAWGMTRERMTWGDRLDIAAWASCFAMTGLGTSRVPTAEDYLERIPEKKAGRLGL